MEREIKFRAWDSYRNEWATMKHHSLVFSDTDWALKHKGGSIKPSTRMRLMQYTGLKDKNGKEIYEGDIFDYDGEMMLFDPGRYVVGWGDGEFALRDVDSLDEEEYHIGLSEAISDTHNPGYTPQIRVIGNIHENPELIKQL